MNVDQVFDDCAGDPLEAIVSKDRYRSQLPGTIAVTFYLTAAKHFACRRDGDDKIPPVKLGGIDFYLPDQSANPALIRGGCRA